MILTKTAILAEIKRGRIKISPFSAKNIGPASYDLALGNDIRIFKKGAPFAASEKAHFRNITKLISIKKGYRIQPGEVILGVTKEKITLPEDIAGWLEGRSRFARIGLMIHISAPFIQPGISSHQVLEIANLSPRAISVKPGLKVCQFVFERCEGKAKYEGIFKRQNLP